MLGFGQELYGVNEMDENLWKAYFRSNAEYITRLARPLIGQRVLNLPMVKYRAKREYPVPLLRHQGATVS